MKNPFSKRTPAERRATLADQLSAAESEAVAAQHERVRLALAGESTDVAESQSLKTTARIQTLRDALAQIDREIAAAEAAELERARRKRHEQAANIFAARLEDARRQRAEVDNFVRDVRPLVAFHDASAVGFANALLGPAADHIGQPIVRALDVIVGTFERAIASLKAGDANADDLARRALANQ